MPEKPNRPRNAGDGRPPARRRQAPPAGRGRKKKTKTSFAVFYIITLLTAVAICLVLFVMAFNTFTQNNPAVQGTPPPTASPPVVEGKDIRKFTGLITAVNAYSEPRSVSLLDVETGGRAETYIVHDGTSIKTKNGTQMVFGELKVGGIYEASYEAKDNRLTVLSESPLAREINFKKNIKIDTELSTITVGNEIYNFNSSTIILSDGAPYSIGRITETDTLSMIEYNQTVWCVWLETGHGFLRVDNVSKVIGGTLWVDSDIYALSDIDGLLPLGEGAHRVSVEGANIEPYDINIFIGDGDTTTVDLINVTLRKAQLTVVTNEPDCVIIVDGVVASQSDGIELDFGSHTVRVEKEGFVSVQQEISVSTLNHRMTVNLLKIIMNGRLVISTSPSGAEIFIDGVFAGYSTLTYDVETGGHSVTARLSGFNDTTINVNVTDGDNPYYLIMTAAIPDPFPGLPLEPTTPDIGPLGP